MRHAPSRLNRTWLAVVGLVLLVLGALVTGVATGAWASVLPADVVDDLPGQDDAVIASPAGWDASWVPVLVGVVALVVALASARWLIAQVPRRHEAKDLRLHGSSLTGLTACAPSVLTDAVEEQAQALAGVSSPSAVLRGSVRSPDLTIHLVVDDRADLGEVLREADSVLAASVVTALDTRLARLGVLVDVQRTRRTADQITV